MSLYVYVYMIVHVYLQMYVNETLHQSSHAAHILTHGDKTNSTAIQRLIQSLFWACEGSSMLLMPSIKSSKQIAPRSLPKQTRWPEVLERFLNHRTQFHR